MDPARLCDRPSTNPRTTTGPRGATIVAELPRVGCVHCHASQAGDEATAVRNHVLQRIARGGRRTTHEQQSERRRLVASMLAFLSPNGDEAAASRDQVISISDRLLPWEVAKNADPEKKNYPGGQSGLHPGVEPRPDPLWQGRARDEEHGVHEPGARRRPSPFPLSPSSRWRRGESVALKTARDDSMVSLEVAAHSQLALRPANGI